jgi:hypothetical protein
VTGERDAITRRQAISLTGGAIAGGLLLPGAQPAAAAATETDGELMYHVLAVELLVITVYERVIASGQLTPDHAALAHQLLSYEHVHARVLGREVHALGMPAPPSLAGVSSSGLDAILASKTVQERLTAIADERTALQLLIRAEEVAEGAYHDAIPKLTDARLLLRSAELMATEAQHRTLLSFARDPGDVDKAVPVAFVQGRG